MSSLLAASRLPIALPPRDAAVDPIGPEPSWSRLNFAMQHQEQTEWCWAATSVSVAAHYEPRSRWSQCRMVNAEKGLETCCREGAGESCNQPNVLDGPLRRAEVLDHKEAAPASFEAVRGEIDAGRPLAWRIGWEGGGGHFAVIEGYQRFGEPWVAVEDPWWGSSDVAVSTLTGGSYQGTGRWTHSYFTRSPPAEALDTAVVAPVVAERTR
jgi:Papain-like cysteine protease AvrRpt2